MKATINRPPPVEQPPAEVTLTMSDKEADVVRSLLGRITLNGACFVSETVYGLYTALGSVGARSDFRRYFEREDSGYGGGIRVKPDAQVSK